MYLRLSKSILLVILLSLSLSLSSALDATTQQDLPTDVTSVEIAPNGTAGALVRRHRGFNRGTEHATGVDEVHGATENAAASDGQDSKLEVLGAFTQKGVQGSKDHDSGFALGGFAQKDFQGSKDRGNGFATTGFGCNSYAAVDWDGALASLSGVPFGTPNRQYFQYAVETGRRGALDWTSTFFYGCGRFNNFTCGSNIKNHGGCGRGETLDPTVKMICFDGNVGNAYECKEQKITEDQFEGSWERIDEGWGASTAYCNALKMALVAINNMRTPREGAACFQPTS